MKRIKLSEIANLTVGFVGTMAKHYVESGVPFLRSLNIKPFFIDDSDLKYISHTFANELSKSELHENDVIIVRTGIPGTCCVVSKEYDGCNCADVVIVHPDLSMVNPHYLAAYINVWGQKQILDNKVGAIQQHFNVHTAEEMIVYLPEKSIQDRVANLIRSINKKLFLNSRLCAELEAMAKTLFDYWFVQFDFPDENGRPYRSSGGKMEWCKELGQEIPQGWKATTIGSIATCHDSERIPLSDSQRQEIPGDIPYYGATGMMGHVNRPIFDGNYVLMAEDGSVMDKDGHPILQRIHRPCWINNHAHVLEPVEGYTCMLLYLLLKDVPVIKIKTGSIQMKINQANMNAYHIIEIPEQLRQKANKTLTVIDKTIDKLSRESEKLSDFRNWLLPILMNGQVKVGKAEEMK